MSNNRFYTVLLSTAFLILWKGDLAAQTITGIGGRNTCVFADNSCTYQISGYNYNAAPDDKWCVIGGKINGGSDSCLVNHGSGIINITWNGGIPEGKILYYKPSGSVTPIAEFTVRILPVGRVQCIISQPAFPFFQKGVFISIPLVGEDDNTCSTTMSYQWQQSSDGKIYADIPGASNKDYTVEGVFTQNVYLRRMVFPSDNAGSVFAVSQVVLIAN